MCPPIRHNGPTWRIRLNLCFLPATRVQNVQNPNGKTISSANFVQLMADCRRACLGMSFPLIICPFTWRSWPQLIHATWAYPSPMCPPIRATSASFSPPESITQTASRTVQPFFHISHQSVVGNVGACPSPSNYPFTWGICTAISDVGSLGTPDSASQTTS